MHNVVHRCLFTYGRGTQASALRLRSYFVAMSPQCRRNAATTQTKTPTHLCRDRQTSHPIRKPSATQTKTPIHPCRDSQSTPPTPKPAATQTKTPAHLCRDNQTTLFTRKPATTQTETPTHLCRDSDVGTVSKSSSHKKLAQFSLQRTQLTMSELRNVIPLFLRGITLYNGLIHKCVHYSSHLADDSQRV